MGKLEKISAWNLTKVKSKKRVIDEARTRPGGWGPRGRRPTGGGGLARSRTCVCVNTFMLRGGTRRGGRMN